MSPRDLHSASPTIVLSLASSSSSSLFVEPPLSPPPPLPPLNRRLSQRWRRWRCLFCYVFYFILFFFSISSARPPSKSNFYHLRHAQSAFFRTFCSVLLPTCRASLFLNRGIAATVSLIR